MVVVSTSRFLTMQYSILACLCYSGKVNSLQSAHFTLGANFPVIVTLSSALLWMLPQSLSKRDGTRNGLFLSKTASFDKLRMLVAEAKVVSIAGF
jgi:hypothetical protein